jgi:PST family polysaccharide transporter
MLAMVALATPLSQYTFNSDDYALDLALLGPLVLFVNIQGGQVAVLQGMRRIGDLARLNVIGAGVGTVVAVALYGWLGLRGIIPSLLLIALIQLIVTWRFSRRVAVPKVQLTWKESLQTSSRMIRLGLVFMWNGLLIALVAYLTRSWISQELDLVAVGIFTAAFSLSGMFVNFILGAMGADYYPRLTAVNHDHDAMRRLVNEQAEIGLLLAVPGLLATLTLAPWIVRLFFTSEFLPAAELLQWFVLGCLGRIISWPLGFVMLALGKARWFFATETSANFLHLGMIWIGLSLVGLEGVAISSFCLYLFYIGLVYSVASHLIGFNWAASTLRLLYIFLPLVLGAFVSARMLSLPIATAMGVLVTGVATVFCLRELVQRLGEENNLVQRALGIPGARRLLNL